MVKALSIKSGRLGSNSGRVIPKTLKMVSTAAPLGASNMGLVWRGGAGLEEHVLILASPWPVIRTE